MIHRSHTYYNLLLVEKRDCEHLDHSVWKWRKASVTLMTDILHNRVSLHQFRGNFGLLRFLAGCQHRQYRVIMTTGCNQLYPHLPLFSMGLGVTGLKSHATESLEGCSKWLTLSAVVTSRDCMTLPCPRRRAAELLIVLKTREAKQRLFTSEASRLICPGHGLNGWWGQINSPTQQHEV